MSPGTEPGCYARGVRRCRLGALLALLLGCPAAPSPTPAGPATASARKDAAPRQADDAAEPAAQAETARPEAAAQAPKAAAQTPVKTVELAPGVTMPAKTPQGIPVLTPLEFALIMLDPHDLDVDQRRKRAYARRKIIMNNPDSPTARALADLADAHRAGDIEVPSKDTSSGGSGSGITFHARGTKPTSGRPPAGWRPEDDTPSPSETSPETASPEKASPESASPEKGSAP